jgi:hypothetical protein
MLPFSLLCDQMNGSVVLFLKWLEYPFRGRTARRVFSGHVLKIETAAWQLYDMVLPREWPEAIKFSAQPAYRSKEKGLAIFQLHTGHYFYTIAIWSTVCKRHTELVKLYGHQVTLLIYVKYCGKSDVIRSILAQGGAKFLPQSETIGHFRQSFKLHSSGKNDMISQIILYCMLVQ